MEFKGTKGKWEFVHTNQHPTEENEYHSVVQMPKIAISITNTKFLSKNETEANAKLIAAAPEMFEMLVKMKNKQDWDIEDYFEIENLLNKITQ